ncbi:MAG: GEVED domain-containing protein [Bacteroidia bacterium]
MKQFYHIFKVQLTVIITVILLVVNVNNGLARSGAILENIQSDSSASIIFRAPSYCSTGGKTGENYGITEVIFNTIDNSTATNLAYTDYTASQITSVIKGNSYNINAYINTVGNYTFYSRVWIDWNQDGTFNSTTEQYDLGTVTNKASGLSTLCPLSITVPATATLGTTRMRITTGYGAAYPDPCRALGSFSGETEDYGITVSNPPGASYGIYAPGVISGITDCEIYAQGGSGTAGCLVCSPTDAAYVNKTISTFPVITATNVSCTNKSITLATAASSPTWSGSSPISGSGASTNVTFTTTGRKDVTMTSGVTCPSAASPTASPNATIPDYSCSGGISSNIVISGYTGCTINTANITVLVNITHTRVYDLVLFLIAPNGKILSLAAHNSPSGGANFTNTIFSDAGSSNISSGTAPYTGTYKPRGYIGTDCKTSDVATFAAIAGAGYNPTGTWTLFVSDGAPSNPGGILLNWTLNLPAATGGGFGASTYTGFTNMMMAPPSSGTITGTANGCPDLYNYASSTAGTPGITYSWSISPTTGVTITSPTASATDITFPNSTTTYTVTCTPNSECCGALTAVTYTTTINASPVVPTASASNASPCTGGTTTLTATAPASSSYAWYDDPTKGNLLGTGASYTIPSVTTGLTIYYVEAVNVKGCASTARKAVNVTGTVTTTPTTSGGVSRCGAGVVTLSISSPQAGYIYTWYTGSCGGTQVQSNTSSTYTSTLSSTTTYYVSATAPGCSPSSCATVTATVNASPPSLTWLGTTSGANNWFTPSNWVGGCLPSCGSNVTIPATSNNPDIGFNAAGGAACKNLVLQASAVLSFSDSKAELSICGNFTHTGTFTSNNKGVVLFIGTTAQTYIKTGAGDLNSVVLNNSAGTPTLTLSSDMTLGSAGNFTFQRGKVITGTNNLIIKNTENTSIDGYNATSYVEGNLRRYINSGATGSYDFPVGQSTQGYQLAGIEFTQAPSSISYLTANFQMYGSLPGPLNLWDGPTTCSGIYNQNALNNGYWTISANTANNNSGMYNMTLYSTTYSNNYSGYTIMSKHNGSSSWGLVNGDGSIGNCVQSPITAVRRNNMKGFSSFGIAQGSNPLPIELLFFAAGYNNKSVDVTWSTASEKNNNYFTIERSQDAQNFIVIGKVASKAIAGNSITTLNYFFKDIDVKPGVYYYRLKQTDFDGQYVYSALATVTIDGEEENNVMIVKPNPTIGKADIVYIAKNTTYSQLSVLDSRGELILSEKIRSEKGNNKYTIDLSKHIDGIYYIMLSVEDKVYKSKIFKNQ